MRLWKIYYSLLEGYRNKRICHLPLKTVRNVLRYTSKNYSPFWPTKLVVKMTNAINNQSFCDVWNRSLYVWWIRQWWCYNRILKPRFTVAPLTKKRCHYFIYIYTGLYINKEVFRQEHNSNINDKLAGQNLNHFLYPSLELGVRLYKTGE